jgi:hypothetical protein
MDAVDYGKLLEQLIRIEGAKLAPYRDAAGNLIVAPDLWLSKSRYERQVKTRSVESRNDARALGVEG